MTAANVPTTASSAMATEADRWTMGPRRSDVHSHAKPGRRTATKTMTPKTVVGVILSYLLIV